MNVDAIKIDLLDKIEHADSNQLKELYGLIINYFNGNDSTEEWDSLPEIQKNLILKGLDQANAGMGTPVKDVTQRLRNKYGLNG